MWKTEISSVNSQLLRINSKTLPMANKGPKTLAVSQTLSLSSTPASQVPHLLRVCQAQFCLIAFVFVYLLRILFLQLSSQLTLSQPWEPLFQFCFNRKTCPTTLYKITSLSWSLFLLTLRYLFFHSISHHLIIYVFAYCDSFPRILAARWQVFLPVLLTVVLPALQSCARHLVRYSINIYETKI